jgi:hypothetical protein
VATIANYSLNENHYYLKIKPGEAIKILGGVCWCIETFPEQRGRMIGQAINLTNFTLSTLLASL